ncbi:MAG: BatA domain-containing protein [Planctomycetes bacterium]|nr:BatA domain-containing protein [Planctomycetota bacterium]
MLASLIFLNPFTMIIGGALIASPIIIHLINRMRFKRVRWAAMEFLLKAQKRSRRRMIIEQLILLLLRILLVVLIAVLLSRLIEKKEDKQNESQGENRPPPALTRHVIIVDDSASMADRFKIVGGADDGKESTAADRAKKNIKEVIIGSVKDDNRNPHEFFIIRTSNPKKPENFGLLNEESRSRITDFIDKDYVPQLFHFGYQPALEAAQTIFKEDKTINLALHIVGDFREKDWNESTKDTLAKYFEYFETAKINVTLHDVIAPRRETDKPVIASDNLAIVEFVPESRVVLKNVPVEFKVTVANYSGSDKQGVQVKVMVNDKEQQDGSVVFDHIPANGTATKYAVFSFSLPANTKNEKEKEDGVRFGNMKLVTARIDKQTTGLAIDDLHYTVVEVREKLHILLVDNRETERFTENSESFYLWKSLSTGNDAYEVQIATAAQMEKMNLQTFSAIVLCDIPLLSPLGVDKLDAFLAAGGGVGFFMGPSIDKPTFYNDVLWKDGKGMFPLPLLEIANKDKKPEELSKIQIEQRFSPYRKLLVRKDMRKHPAMELFSGETRRQENPDLKNYNLFFSVAFARYYLVDQPRWKPGVDVQTLLYLPNYRDIRAFETPTKNLLKKLREITDPDTRVKPLEQKIAETKEEAKREELEKQLASVKAEMAKFAKYQKHVKENADIISNTVGRFDNPLYKLADWIENLLENPGEPNAVPAVPSMIEFWQFPELSELKTEFQQLLDVIKFGDPFYVAKQYKNGRVLAFMGSAGSSGPEGRFWNSHDEFGGGYFPLLMKKSLLSYLTLSGGSGFDMPLGKSWEFDFERAAYDPTVQIWRVYGEIQPSTELTEEKAVVKNDDGGSKIIEGGGARMLWKFTEGTKPGVYLFEFKKTWAGRNRLGCILACSSS